jgi:hypothetical protein
MLDLTLPTHSAAIPGGVILHDATALGDGSTQPDFRNQHAEEKT